MWFLLSSLTLCSHLYNICFYGLLTIMLVQDSRFITVTTMDIFLNDMDKEKPIRFTSTQLRIATDNFFYLLGSGRFGSIY